MYSGATVEPYYDSLIAKLIAHAPTRKNAVERMSRALSMCVVEGIRTSIPLHQRILAEPAFLEGRYDTKLIEDLGL